MKTTYRQNWLGFLVAILMVPTAYGQGETVLVANFMNGNNSVLNSRVYLFNPTDTAGQITVRVFALPLLSGLPQELTTTPLSLGTLGPRSAVNIKLAEDILLPLGISLPYINDGGNLTLEFTIQSEKVRGVAQVFTSSFAFGTYPLLEPESTSVTVPGGEIPSGELPDGSVTTNKIVDGAVTGSKIANGAVGSVQLADTVTFGASSSPGLINVVNNNNIVTDSLGNVSNAGQLDLGNSTGNTTVILGNLANAGVLNLNDAGGNLKVALSVGGDGGQMGVNNSTGNNTFFVGNLENSGVLSLSNSSSNLTVLLANLSDEGALGLWDAGDNLKVILAATSNGGSLGLNNASGTLTAGIDGATGQVFGTTKSFIVADPSDSSRKIKYTSVEGPEAAIYVRGTANLVSGQGYIEFPDHFAVMAVPSSITVSLTPRSASSMGLAAVSVSSQGIDVAELGGGANSYSFDYVAYAVRKGFEDYEVYLTQEQVVILTGQAQVQALALRPRSLLTTSPLKAIQRQE